MENNFNQSFDENSIVQFNNQEFTFDIYLINKQYGYRVPHGSVISLTITDSIYSIFSSGYIILNNSYNALENFSDSQIGAAIKSVNNSGISFTGYGRDLLLVKIKPNVGNDGTSEKLFSAEKWSLNYVFAIYDEDELHVPEKQNEKYKIFKFRDIREQTLTESFLGWSTSQLLNGNLRVTSAEVPTGIAIKDVIQKSLSQFKNTFGYWDDGSSRLFYSSTANSSSLDDIEYILDRHTSIQNNDNCILKFERENTWTLMPVSEYFNRALKKDQNLPGDFTIDLFTLHDESGSEDAGVSVVSDFIKSSYQLQFNPNEFFGLTNFSFVNIDSDDGNRELITTPVHSYNSKDGSFVMDLQNNNIVEVDKFYQEHYVNKMYGTPAASIIPINDDKINNKLIHHTFSLYSEPSNFKEGRNMVLQKALAYAPGISFTVPGFTVRRSGRFVSILTTTPSVDIPFQNILQGEWFITQITHKFNGNKYTNTITAIKPYTFKEIRVK